MKAALGHGGTSSRGVKVGLVALTWLAVALLAAALAAPAEAAWQQVSAAVVDPDGNGYVPLLNVRVAAQAVNDSAAVTAVELSDDGDLWLAVPYTGRPVDWVLAGGDGPATVLVRFVAADGSVSPVVVAGATVDTRGPWTAAERATVASDGRVRLTFRLGDAASDRVWAQVVARGPHGVTRHVTLGWLRPGTHTVRLATPFCAGSWRWQVRAVDRAGWAQERATAGSFTVR